MRFSWVFGAHWFLKGQPLQSLRLVRYRFLSVPFSSNVFSKRYFFVVSAKPVVTVFVVFKTFGAAFVGAVGRDVAVNALSFQKRVVVTAAVAGIGQQILPWQLFFAQAGPKLPGDLLQALVVFLVGKIGRDVRDYVVLGVNGHLCMVVELAGLAGLYADTGIGVCGAVVGLV